MVKTAEQKTAHAEKVAREVAAQNEAYASRVHYVIVSEPAGQDQLGQRLVINHVMISGATEHVTLCGKTFDDHSWGIYVAGARGRRAPSTRQQKQAHADGVRCPGCRKPDILAYYVSDN